MGKQSSLDPEYVFRQDATVVNILPTAATVHHPFPPINTISAERSPRLWIYLVNMGILKPRVREVQDIFFHGMRPWIISANSRHRRPNHHHTLEPRHSRGHLDPPTSNTALGEQGRLNSGHIGYVGDDGRVVGRYSGEVFWDCIVGYWVDVHDDHRSE